MAKRMHRIRVQQRRFVFKFGLSVVAVKEFRSPELGAPIQSFAFALNTERSEDEIQRRVRAEILKRIKGI